MLESIDHFLINNLSAHTCLLTVVVISDKTLASTVLSYWNLILMRELPASETLSSSLSSDFISDVIPADWLVIVSLESLIVVLRS
jgi:hypothetical protein